MLVGDDCAYLINVEPRRPCFPFRCRHLFELQLWGDAKTNRESVDAIAHTEHLATESYCTLLGISQRSSTLLQHHPFLRTLRPTANEGVDGCLFLLPFFRGGPSIRKEREKKIDSFACLICIHASIISFSALISTHLRTQRVKRQDYRLARLSPPPTRSSRLFLLENNYGMYSQSNSFLGGGNSLRPGAQQYGGGFGQPGQQQQQPGQQQPSPFAPQPTGFGQAPTPLQQQYTGYPGLQQPQPQAPQLQPQFTGFPGQQAPQQQPFQTGAPPMPSIPQQYQQQFQQQLQQQQPQPQLPQPTGFNAAPPQLSQPTGFSLTPHQQQQPQQTATPPAAPMKPQATGFSQMAASFRSSGSTAAPTTTSSAPAPKSNKIPNIRLGFITAADQAKFETLFKSAVGDNESTMSGEKARDLLLRSRLDGDSLSHIWCVYLF